MTVVQIVGVRVRMDAAVGVVVELLVIHLAMVVIFYVVRVRVAVHRIFGPAMLVPVSPAFDPSFALSAAAARAHGCLLLNLDVLDPHVVAAGHLELVASAARASVAKPVGTLSRS